MSVCQGVGVVCAQWLLQPRSDAGARSTSRQGLSSGRFVCGRCLRGETQWLPTGKAPMAQITPIYCYLHRRPPCYNDRLLHTSFHVCPKSLVEFWFHLALCYFCYCFCCYCCCSFCFYFCCSLCFCWCCWGSKGLWLCIQFCRSNSTFLVVCLT